MQGEPCEKSRAGLLLTFSSSLQSQFGSVQSLKPPEQSSIAGLGLSSACAVKVLPGRGGDCTAGGGASGATISRSSTSKAIGGSGRRARETLGGSIRFFWQSQWSSIKSGSIPGQLAFIVSRIESR